MKVTPKQLKKIIRRIKKQKILNSQKLEFFEAYAANAPKQYKKQMMHEADSIFKQYKFAKKNIDKSIKFLNSILAEDEKVNGWKGENRYIDFNP